METHSFRSIKRSPVPCPQRKVIKLIGLDRSAAVHLQTNRSLSVSAPTSSPMRIVRTILRKLPLELARALQLPIAARCGWADPSHGGQSNSEKNNRAGKDTYLTRSEITDVGGEEYPPHYPVQDLCCDQNQPNNDTSFSYHLT